MTRRQALTPALVRLLCASYKPNQVGYGTLAKRHGLAESTVRDAVQRRTAYAANAMKGQP